LPSNCKNNLSFTGFGYKLIGNLSELFSLTVRFYKL
jgi:hypothetical protein